VLVHHISTTNLKARLMNTKLPLISIITPVYNAESYLMETAQSVLSQTYLNWEWILVDDCSSDSSYDLLLKLAKMDSRILVSKNIQNMRAFATRNKCLEKVKGTYLAFLDADDLWAANKLEYQLNFMEAHNYAITYTGFKRFRYSLEDVVKLVNVPVEATYKSIITNNYIATSSVMINVGATGRFTMQDVYYDDFTLWLELLKRVDTAYGINEFLMYYRLSENSLSRNKFKSAAKVYEMFTNKMNFGFLKSRILFVKWVINTAKRYLLD
jgi:teichuronic acid biosynthesis glycosyltransferase TuaG